MDEKKAREGRTVKKNDIEALKKRLSTLLRMTSSPHEGESEEAGRQLMKLIQKHGLTKVLAENPEWLWGETDSGKLREAMEANDALARQVDAVIAENKRLRTEVAETRKAARGGVDYRSMKKLEESEELEDFLRRIDDRRRRTNEASQRAVERGIRGIGKTFMEAVNQALDDMKEDMELRKRELDPEYRRARQAEWDEWRRSQNNNPVDNQSARQSATSDKPSGASNKKSGAFEKMKNFFRGKDGGRVSKQKRGKNSG